MWVTENRQRHVCCAEGHRLFHGRNQGRAQTVGSTEHQSLLEEGVSRDRKSGDRGVKEAEMSRAAQRERQNEATRLGNLRNTIHYPPNGRSLWENGSWRWTGTAN